MCRLITDRRSTEIMSRSQRKKYFRFEKPATYRIRIQGDINDSLTGRLGGMTITTTRSADKVAVTTLEGHVADQAALSGLLNTLYDLHMVLLSVECLDGATKE